MQTVDWWRIDLGEQEIDSVTEAIRNKNISQGVVTERLENALAKRLGVPYVVCTTSGTSALMMSFLALGLRPGDEVIVPDRTFIATAHAAQLLGAKIRLVDVCKSRPVMDPELLEAIINDKTKVIVPVHLNGRAADVKAVKKIADKYELVVVEDTAQAFMSRGEDGSFLGTKSRFGCFSLGMAKLITTGQGGFIACHSEEDSLRLKLIRNQGVTDVTREREFALRAGNYKFTDIQAAIGLAQLERLDNRIAHQRLIYQTYEQGLQGIKGLKPVEVAIDKGELPLRVDYVFPERDWLVEQMAKKGVKGVIGAKCLHECPHLECNGQGQYAASQAYSDYMLTLPGGPDQPIENIHRTIECIREIMASAER